MPSQQKDNVIHGPWKKEVNQPDVDIIQVQEDLAFADDLLKNVMVQLIHTLGQNGIDVNENDFIRDCGIIIEAVKASIYRDMGFEHLLQDFAEHFVDLTIEADDTPTTAVNLEEIELFLKQIKDDDDGPEVS